MNEVTYCDRKPDVFRSQYVYTEYYALVMRYAEEHDIKKRILPDGGINNERDASAL